MKKNRIIAVLVLTALFISLITACSSNSSMNNGSEPSNVESTPTEPSIGETTPYEPVFLLFPSMDFSTTLSTLYSEFADATHYGLYCESSKEVLKDLENSTLKNPLNGQEMKYAYSECTYKNKETKEYGVYYGVYDVYKSDDLKTEIAVLHGTDLICFYFDTHDEGNEVQLTDTEAESIAASFLCSMVGENVFSQFECTSVKKSQMDLFAYIIRYSKSTNGHKTDEKIKVYIDKSGKVVGYNGYNICKYDSLKGKFNDERIEAAKEAITDKIISLKLKNIEINAPTIVANLDGELYLRVNFSYEDENGFECGQTALVNIN